MTGETVARSALNSSLGLKVESVMKTSKSIAALALCVGILTAAVLPSLAQTKPAAKPVAKPKASATTHRASTRSGKHHRKTTMPHATSPQKSAPKKN
jgi:hypothetical protein